MWNTNTLWFEISIVSNVILLGHIFLGHFEERGSRMKKLVKYLATVAIIVSISIIFGRTVSLIFLGIFFIPVLYIHAVLLPKKGINGWTGEPKSKYYEFRGWSKNIFDNNKNDTGGG